MKNLLALVIGIIPLVTLSQQRYDIIIDEIMADPSPAVGLPAAEWIELKNTSSQPINLQNWRTGDASGISGPFPSYILQPDSFLIVGSAASLPLLSMFGPAISVTSFPSLDNDDDIVFLRSPSGLTIHAVQYHSSLYRNEIKKDGGWSLEMIDTHHPCTGNANWKASSHPAGGTPGNKNSADATLTDIIPPRLQHAYTTDSTTIILVLSETADSMAASSLPGYTISGGLTFTNAMAIAPLFKEIRLKTAIPLLANTVYAIHANNIKGCNNIAIPGDSVRTGLPADPLPGEWMVNEILFDPRPNAYDYVEFYNHSLKIIDASKLYIATRNNTGIHLPKLLCTSPFYIFPGEYIVVTEDAASLALNYLVKDPGRILSLPSLPSFPDNEGIVIALNSQGVITDEVHYKDDWHFKLIAGKEGIALERIDPSSSSSEPGNWHSAGSGAGYGTPGYQNSQYKKAGSSAASIEINPKVFSPDNDGYNDVLTIYYRMNEPGFVASIIIYDASGRVVRHLVQNDLLSLNGYWNWDGLHDNGGRLAVGPYVVVVELFNLKGKKQVIKNGVVVVRRNTN
jgi:hypothetical protein